jgi:hypothetical protein
MRSLPPWRSDGFRLIDEDIVERAAVEAGVERPRYESPRRLSLTCR